jgi:hypothetical protein
MLPDCRRRLLHLTCALLTCSITIARFTADKLPHLCASHDLPYRPSTGVPGRSSVRVVGQLYDVAYQIRLLIALITLGYIFRSLASPGSDSESDRLRFSTHVQSFFLAHMRRLSALCNACEHSHCPRFLDGGASRHEPCSDNELYGLSKTVCTRSVSLSRPVPKV